VPDVICNVSPIQSLRQVELLDLLRLRYGGVPIPPPVAAEFCEGTSRDVES
jgi:predicted nucleic acid-binding protein